MYLFTYDNGNRNWSFHGPRELISCPRCLKSCLILPQEQPRLSRGRHPEAGLHGGVAAQREADAQAATYGSLIGIFPLCYVTIQINIEDKNFILGRSKDYCGVGARPLAAAS